MIPYCGKPLFVLITVVFAVVIKLSSSSPIENGVEMVLKAK